MNLTELNHLAKPYKNRKRKGRGHGSGNGKTAGRGHGGSHSRSGFSRRPHFEGGQQPLFRRIPKRGFTNAPFRVRYDIVNVETLNALATSGVDTIDHATLVAQGVIRSRFGRLKVLGEGELTGKVNVKAAKFSATARRKIEEQGGEAKEI